MILTFCKGTWTHRTRPHRWLLLFRLVRDLLRTVSFVGVGQSDWFRESSDITKYALFQPYQRANLFLLVIVNTCRFVCNSWDRYLDKLGNNGTWSHVFARFKVSLISAPFKAFFPLMSFLVFDDINHKDVSAFWHIHETLYFYSKCVVVRIDKHVGNESELTSAVMTLLSNSMDLIDFHIK